MHAQDFFRRRLACIPGHPQVRTRSLPESASRAAASRPDYPVHPVHPCSIYSPSRLIFPVAGLGCAQRPDSQSASRAIASGPINPVPWLPLSFPAMRQPVDPGEGEGRDCERLWDGRDARAPRRSSSHDVVTPWAQNCRSTWPPPGSCSLQKGALVIEWCPLPATLKGAVMRKPLGIRLLCLGALLAAVPACSLNGEPAAGGHCGGW